jgi:hypothetical protein
MKIALVAVGYNRAKPLLRLLSSLCSASYNNDNISLIVSIDYSQFQNEIVRDVSEISWVHGEKTIIKHESNLGLRKHILLCGDLTADYDAVVVFEDDIIASKSFYLYLKSALDFYRENRKIAGISLYSPMVNEMSERPFFPQLSRFDTYFMKSAQSWGQCWTKASWLDFKEWYNKFDEELVKCEDMPRRIYSWPETSWKKYFMKYMVECDKYFIYPYVSHTTNASEIGQHNKKVNSNYQVPLQNDKSYYCFPTLLSGVAYDVFFESEMLSFDFEGIKYKICCDLYGLKESNFGSRFILSSNRLPFKIYKTFGLSYRPHESNYLYNSEGDDLFLYDLGSSDNVVFNSKKIFMKSNVDYYSFIPWHSSLILGVMGFFGYVKKKLLK